MQANIAEEGRTVTIEYQNNASGARFNELTSVRVNGNITYIFRQNGCIIHHEHTRTHVQRILALHRDGNYISVGRRHGSIKFETPPKRMLTINNGITWLCMHSVACTCEGRRVYIYAIRFERSRYDHVRIYYCQRFHWTCDWFEV